MRTSIICVLTSLLINTPVTGQSSADQIRSLREQSNAAIARHDAQAVVSFLDAEYQITAGSGTLYHDRAAEVDVWLAEFARVDDLLYVRTPESIEVSSSDVRAAKIGEWVGSWTTAEGSERRGGTYAAHSRKVNGLWKLRAELFVTLSCQGAGCS